MKVYCKIPKGGLGNKLFVISHALIFRKLTGSKIYFIKHFELKIGPYIRNEKNKRRYQNYFSFKSYYFSASYWLLKKENIITEPIFNSNYNGHENFIFKELPHWTSFFEKIRPYRDLCKIELFNALSEQNKIRINSLDIIDVAIHIRLGDFKKLNEYDDFSKVGATRTPKEYFLDNIKKIKASHPSFVFHIFTDGYESELDWILGEENIFLIKSINDIVDLYQMSKSKILITSAGSTYSYWAGFLGECQIIQHPDHVIDIR